MVPRERHSVVYSWSQRADQTESNRAPVFRESQVAFFRKQCSLEFMLIHQAIKVRFRPISAYRTTNYLQVLVARLLKELRWDAVNTWFPTFMRLMARFTSQKLVARPVYLSPSLLDLVRRLLVEWRLSLKTILSIPLSCRLSLNRFLQRCRPLSSRFAHLR
jgi:hypothetical protein